MAHFENIGFHIGSSYSKYRFFNKKYRLKKVPPNSHKDLKLKKKHFMNFCATIATIKFI